MIKQEKDATWPTWEGEEVTPVEKPKKMAPVDLMAALKESLAQLPKKTPQRVEAAQQESEVKAVAAKKAKESRRKPAAQRESPAAATRPNYSW